MSSVSFNYIISTHSTDIITFTQSLNDVLQINSFIQFQMTCRLRIWMIYQIIKKTNSKSISISNISHQIYPIAVEARYFVLVVKVSSMYSVLVVNATTR